MADVLVSIEQAIRQVDNEIQHLVGLRKHLRRTLQSYSAEIEQNTQSLTNEVIVLRLVEAAGENGITLKEIDERLHSLGLYISRNTISSYLSRARKQGHLHNYFKRWWTITYWKQWKSKEQKGGD